MSENEVVTQSPPPQIVPRETITPMHLIATAVEQGKDLDTIERLMELEQKYKANQAREEYFKALSAFKQEPIHVSKDKLNKQYGSMYTTLGNLVNTVNAAMAPFGLNARWSIEQTELISVTCILSHTLGHSEQVTMRAEPDASGSKNPLQQIKSTITYLEGATFQAVTGIVSSEGGTLDDDGNAAGGQTLTENQIKKMRLRIEEVKADEAAFLKFCKVDAIEDILQKNYTPAMNALDQKKKS